MKRFFKKITGLLALALVLTAIAGEMGKTSAEENDNAEENEIDLASTYEDQIYDFSIDFPEGFYLRHSRQSESQEGMRFSPSREAEAHLAIWPRGGQNMPLSEPEESKILIDGRGALKREWKLDYGLTRIFISLEENYPESWSEDNQIEIWTYHQEGTEAFEPMLESIRF